MVSHVLIPVVLILIKKAYILEATRTWHINMNFLIADVIYFVSVSHKGM